MHSLRPLYHGQATNTNHSKQERERRNKWVQRQRKAGNIHARPEDAPSKSRNDVDIHPPAYNGPLKDKEAEVQIAIEAALSKRR